MVEVDLDGNLDLKRLSREYAGRIEKPIIINVLRKFNGNKSRTARQLKIDYKTLLSKIEVYGISSIENTP